MAELYGPTKDRDENDQQEAKSLSFSYFVLENEYGIDISVILKTIVVDRKIHR
jgi:hypothetical protein